MIVANERYGVLDLVVVECGELGQVSAQSDARAAGSGVEAADTEIGNLNPPGATTKYVSSGDVVSIIQDKTYLSVKKFDADAGTTSTTDLLAEVDPKTGVLKRIIGDTKTSNLYGMGYWGGKAYGFNAEGGVLEIDVTNGSSIVVQTLQNDGGATIPFYGAGVTTNAPAN